MASDEPMVEVPTASSPVASAWYRSAMMLTHRRSSTDVTGYSSWSMKFLEMASSIRSFASGSIQVVTKLARLSTGLPSSSSSSWMSW